MFTEYYGECDRIQKQKNPNPLNVKGVWGGNGEDMLIVSPQTYKQGWEKKSWAGHRRKYHLWLSCEMLLHFANISFLQKLLFRILLACFKLGQEICQ